MLILAVLSNVFNFLCCFNMFLLCTVCMIYRYWVYIVFFLILCLYAAVSAPLEPCLSSSVTGTAGVRYLYQILLSKIYMIYNMIGAQQTTIERYLS